MGKTPNNAAVRFWRDPDLPGVEVRFSSYNEEAFRKHVHAAYSIGFLETGRTTFDLEGRAHTACAGQMVFIAPQLAHACNPDLDSAMTYVMFYVAPSWLLSVAEEIFGPGGEPPCFPDPVVDDRKLIGHWRTLHRAIAEGAARLEKESLLVQGLAEAITRHGAPGREPRKEGKRTVDAVKACLAANPAGKISLDDLSGASGMSRYHLLRVFQAAVGLPPHAYQNQLRVELGKRLLAEGLSISRVAVEAGFADQSHFSRVFRQFTGATPRQYQAGDRA